MSDLARRDFLKMAGASAALAAWPQALRADAAVRRPNILVFLTDDHGQWAQHAYGNAELKTPNMDRLAARGVRMTRAFTTCPVCSPARASFFTGRMPSQHGIHDWIEEAKQAYIHPGLKGQKLLPELLKQAGYHTALVGKWHCGREREPQPGFDRWFSYWVSQYPHDGLQNFSDQGQQVQEHGPQSPFFTQRALEFMRAHRQDAAWADKPFFLVVGYVDTHGPHTGAPADLAAQYSQAAFGDIPSEPFAPCHGHAKIPVAAKPAAEHTRHVQYYGAVSSIDREIGKIVADLEAAGQLDNTLVVYTGDHGLNAGHHGMWEKGNGTVPQNFLEESILVPCTLAWPGGGLRKNATSNLMVDHCDLFATLLDAAGALPDAATATAINSPGRSYLPALRGTDLPDWRTAQICEYGNARMIRTDRYKLILRYPYAGVTVPSELYDLQADPRETRNCYDDPAHGALIQDLRAQVNKYFARYTVAGHDGLGVQQQPECNAGSPWVETAKRHQA